jgi:hypothetical protein
MGVRNMRRLALACAVTVAACLGPVAIASAHYFMDAHEAEHYVRDHFHNHVGYHYTSASCRPQGQAAPDKGYIYHRWTCYFAVGDSRYSPSCTGRVLVAGSSTQGSYYLRVDYHDGKCPWGVSSDD